MYDRRRLAERLHRAALLGRWSEVRAVADQLNGLSGRHGQAVAGRFRWGRDWWCPAAVAKDRIVIHPDSQTDERDRSGRPPAEQSAASGERFVLWIDAVGGFIVCLGDEVSVGQASADGAVDVPILGDLARRHAVIRRDGEAYSIEPLRRVRIDGRFIEQPTTLADGRLLELGDGVKVRFVRPHPLSSTARLDPVSFHRTQPRTDGVLLMAEACIIGPHPQCHVFAPEIAGEVVLFRQGGGLACRAAEELEIDGVAHSGGGPLAANSRVIGESFSFTLEPLVK